MSIERLQIMPTRSGLPSVQVDGLAYHSLYNPLREAEKFYAGLRLEEADVLLHFGWGLGYCAEILQKRVKPGAQVVVFEPDQALFKLWLTQSASRKAYDDPRFQFVVGPNVCQFFDNWGLTVCQE